jgi:hypothetical protein
MPGGAAPPGSIATSVDEFARERGELTLAGAAIPSMLVVLGLRVGAAITDPAQHVDLPLRQRLPLNHAIVAADVDLRVVAPKVMRHPAATGTHRGRTPWSRRRPIQAIRPSPTESARRTVEETVEASEARRPHSEKWGLTCVSVGGGGGI